MEQVTISGTVYTKASIVAKQFRYTTDYLGQLCRADKIACQVVGRSWYISAESLLAYQDELQILQKNKSEKSNDTAISRTKLPNSYQEKVPVAPRVKRTVKHLHLQSRVPESVSRITLAPIRYTADETDLLPVPQKITIPAPDSQSEQKSVPETNPILPITPSFTQVAVQTNNKKPTSLSFTDVPAVPLRGKITVRPVETVNHATKEGLVTSRELVTPNKVSPTSHLAPATYRFHAARHLATPGAVMPELSTPVLPQVQLPSAAAVAATPPMPTHTPRVARLYVTAILGGLLVAFGGLVGVQSLTISTTEQSAGLSVRLDSLGALFGSVINR